MGTKHPKFVRPNRSIMRRVKDKWRAPRGIDNKQRQKLKWAGAVVNKGYRGAVKGRGNHPCGKKEVYIKSDKEFELVRGMLGNFAIRLQRTLSKRSKEAIRRKAAALNLKVLN
ncbi:MAG: eL32 family ribosomal protein [Candidatus Micrarchaeota archaeon]